MGFKRPTFGAVFKIARPQTLRCREIYELTRLIPLDTIHSFIRSVCWSIEKERKNCSDDPALVGSRDPDHDLNAENVYDSFAAFVLELFCARSYAPYGGTHSAPSRDVDN